MLRQSLMTATFVPATGRERPTVSRKHVLWLGFREAGLRIKRLRVYRVIFMGSWFKVSMLVVQGLGLMSCEFWKNVQILPELHQTCPKMLGGSIRLRCLGCPAILIMRAVSNLGKSIYRLSQTRIIYHVSYSLNSLKGVSMGDYIRHYYTGY